jgi:hypothetical protein
MEGLTNTKDRCTASASALEDRWQWVRRRLEDAAPYLLTQGVIIAKTSGRRRLFVLRFRVPGPGRSRLKSVYLCEADEAEVLARARALLDQIRGPARWSREVAGYARLARAARALVKRLTGR